MNKTVAADGQVKVAAEVKSKKTGLESKAKNTIANARINHENINSVHVPRISTYK
jgi:hypothetical protein